MPADLNFSFQTVYSPNNSNISILYMLSISVPLSSAVLCKIAGALDWAGVKKRVNKAGH